MSAGFYKHTKHLKIAHENICTTRARSPSGKASLPLTKPLTLKAAKTSLISVGLQSLRILFCAIGSSVNQNDRQTLQVTTETHVTDVYLKSPINQGFEYNNKQTSKQ